jgi:hypothetical protein
MGNKCECGTVIPLGDVVCQDCCEHDYDEDTGFMCLNCGKDGAAEVLSTIYDLGKDFYKYGP